MKYFTPTYNISQDVYKRQINTHTHNEIHTAVVGFVLCLMFTWQAKWITELIIWSALWGTHRLRLQNYDTVSVFTYCSNFSNGFDPGLKLCDDTFLFFLYELPRIYPHQYFNLVFLFCCVTWSWSIRLCRRSVDVIKLPHIKYTWKVIMYVSFWTSTERRSISMWMQQSAINVFLF